MKLIFIYLFFAFYSSYGQNNMLTKKQYFYEKLGAKASYVYNNRSGIEIGLVKFPKVPHIRDPSSLNPYISSDIFFKFDNSIVLFQPKFGVEYYYRSTGFKLSIADLTDFNNHSIRIIPEIVLGLFGQIYIAYGYSFGVNNSEIFGNMNHRFSFNLTVPLALFKKERL